MDTPNGTPLSPGDLKDLLAMAERAAAAAAALLAERWGRYHTVLAETAHDVKLQDDRDAEAAVLQVLAESGLPVLAEESGDGGAPIAQDAVHWVVDPLDGTVNYSRGIAYCCVSVALSAGGAPVLGVVNDFTRREVFTGAPGLGAWRDGAPMRVSTVTAPERAILGFGNPAGFDYDDTQLLALHRTLNRFHKVRQPGAAALMMAHVACGLMDAFMEDDISYWDVAAGTALIRAAGGWAQLAPSPTHPWARRIRAASSSQVWAGMDGMFPR